MPIHPIHLAQTATARGWEKGIGTSAKDAQVINGLFEVAENPVLGTKSVYVSKRGGSTTGSTIGSSGETVILKVKSSTRQLFVSDSAFNLYDSASNNLGAVGGVPGSNLNVCEALINDVIVYAFAANGSGWFLYEDAITKNFSTFSASLTSGQATAVGMASTGGIYDGQLLSGSGIPASTRVSDVLDTSRILLSQVATESGTKTVTKEAVAKIIDTTVSGLSIGSIETLDGYFFLNGVDPASGNNGNKIYQSALNDPASYDSADAISADLTGDNIRCIFRIKDYIAAAGANGTIQYFYNAGNATGSVLSPADNLTIDGLILDGAPVFTATGGYFVASDVVGDVNSAEYALYRFNGVNQVTKISNSIWSGIISKHNGAYRSISTAIMGDRTLILLNTSFSSPETVSVVYDPSVNQFSFVQLASGSVLSSYGVRFTKDSSNSTFFWATGNTWTDSSVAYTMTIQTEPQDPAHGFDSTDEWIDLSADIEASGTATLSISDDDYQNWVTKGTFDLTKNKKRIYAAGFHQGPRAYRLQHSANTGFRASQLRVNFSPAIL